MAKLKIHPAALSRRYLHDRKAPAVLLRPGGPVSGRLRPGRLAGGERRPLPRGGGRLRPLSLSPTPEPSDAPSEPSDLPAFSPAQASEEAAWIPCEQGARFGGDPEVDCPLAVWDARVGLNDLSVSFLPQGNADAMSAFIDAEVRIPPTEVTYAGENRALLIRMEGVVLDTGDPREAAGSDDWVYDFMEEFGLPLPASFPMGSLGEDNGFFRNAAISSDGTDTLITLLLTDRAGELRVESGTLDREGMQPWFRIVFQEAP